MSQVFQSALEDRRDHINRMVERRLKGGAKLDLADFMEHVRSAVGPIVDAIHQTFPERVGVATNDLLQLSLDLIESRHLGSQCQYQLMNRLWREVLPRVARIVARDPRRVVGSLCNGVHFMESAKLSKGERWLDLVSTCGALVSDVESLLAIGRFAAWAAGLPQYRVSALPEAQKIPMPLVATMLGKPQLLDEETRQLLHELQSNPWATIPSHEGGGNHGIHLMECGAFRGFGGNFMRPPKVYFLDGQFVVESAGETWHLFADGFGWSIVRAELDLRRLKPNRSVPSVGNSGQIAWDNDRFENPNLAGPTSQAFDGRALAVTTRTSFHVFLIVKTIRSSRDDLRDGSKLR